MQNEHLYYIAPSDELFQDVKKNAMELWDEVDRDHDKFGYATEKKNRIKSIENVADNFMYIIAMFDYGNQQKLMQKLKSDTRLAIVLRKISVDYPLTFDDVLLWQENQAKQELETDTQTGTENVEPSKS